jgi:Icc-related predicted phosphoesterase
MRCHYLSDLHLESQSFRWQLPEGDVLIVAGDLGHARCLDPSRTDKYCVEQRGRINKFMEDAVRNFDHVLLIAGNHDHYDGVFEDTVDLMRRHLPGVTVLENSGVVIDGMRFFGSTLWSDFEGRSDTSMNGVRRRMGEYFFVKTRGRDADGRETLTKFRPEDALRAFDISLRSMWEYLSEQPTIPTVVITHHAPSRQGINPRFAGNGLDGAYVSDLDGMIAGLGCVPYWVHGHTHIRRRYRIGETVMLANCRGFDEKDPSARGFSPSAHFDV